MKSAFVSPEIAAMAYKIADSMSMCEIESYCAPVESVGCRWWDTSQPDDVDEGGVAESLAYLEARGLVVRHPDRPHMVRFTVHDAA